MSDLAKRLRDRAEVEDAGGGCCDHQTFDVGSLQREAAGEIERLTRELAEARAMTRKTMREALEDVASALQRPGSAHVALRSVIDRLNRTLARLDAEEPKP